MKFNFFKKTPQTQDSLLSAGETEPAAGIIRNEKIEKLGLNKLLSTLPWKANDIYLEDNQKQVKAVCSNSDIARVLENCVDHYSQLPGRDTTKANLYKDFIQDAYYLYVAMSKAQIPVNSLETAFVEKAFHQFCSSFNKLMEVEHLRIVEDPVRPE